MKRRKSTTPVNIWTFACRAPIDGLDRLEDQLRRAHRYRNALVEIEHRRRDEIRAAQARNDRLGPLLRVIAHLEGVVEDAKEQAKRSRAGGGGGEGKQKRARLRNQIADARQDLVVLRCLRTMTKALVHDAELTSEYERIQAQANIAIKAVRNNDEAPYWGTYLAVEKATESWHKTAEPPKFLRYRGTGRVAVQIQGGMSVKELMSGEDLRLRLLPAGQLTPPAAPVSRRQIARAIAYGVVHFCRAGHMDTRSEYKIVKLRVGSDGRAPVWVTLPVYIDRPLPPDGIINNAWIIRRLVGLRWSYAFQCTVESSSFCAPPKDGHAGVLAIDIGARDLPTGQVRAAMWLDDSGSAGEVVGPLTRSVSPTRRVRGRRQVPDDLQKVTDLQAIRSERFDDARDALVAYCARAELPDWLRERTRHAARWRSPARIGALVRDWQRHDGDEEICSKLRAYLDKDRHLYDWYAREKSRYAGRRRARYRNFAVWAARTYSTIVIAERVYVRERRPAEDAPQRQGESSRVIMRQAAPGELVKLIEEAAKKYGASVVEVPLEGDTAWALDRRVCDRLLASARAQCIEALALETTTLLNSKTLARSPRSRRLGNARREDPLANQDVTPENGR